MDNIIRAIELLGKTASLQSLSADEVKQVLNPLDLDVAVQQAIVSKDTTALEMMLDVRNKIVCMVNKPEPDDAPEDTPEQEEEQPDKQPESSKYIANW
ncbi:hypothetical protein [Rheinheimera pleomorphica]|uniref:hypothetical protein n=1 Tax=Rheinheimera pleomorphica TaxID=2703963 RepID=UPI0014240DFB|nr:hypothetical protein [Rheinheimera pleomorphica]